MNKMFAHLKQIVILVTLIYTVLDVVALLGIILPPFTITTSKTLRGFIVGFGVLGGVLGYFFTATAWAGKARARRLHRRNVYLAIFCFPFLVFLGTLVVLRPEMAMKYPLVEHIREFLITAGPLPNFIVGFGVFLASYLLIGAITLNSPKLSQSK